MALALASGCGKERAVKEGAAAIAAVLEETTPEPTAENAHLRCLAEQIFTHDDLALLSCHPDDPGMGKRMLIERLARDGSGAALFRTTLDGLVRDPDLRVAQAATRALLKIAPAPSPDTVSGLLSSEQTVVVLETLRQISLAPERACARGEHAGPTSCRAVVEAIRGVVLRYRHFDNVVLPMVYAALALGALDAPVVEPVLTMIAADVRPAVREAARAAFHAIQGISPPAGLPPTQPVSDRDLEVGQRWRGKKVQAIVHTSRGVFTIALDADAAPHAVTSFTALAKSGYYDGTPIRRAWPGLTIEAGDPSGTGYGDSGYTVPSETGLTAFERGTVGMLPVTERRVGAAFFITLSRRPGLDGTHAVLGRVASNVELLDLLTEGDEITEVVVSVVD
jgi:peptidylprolyl isomerase